MRGKNYMIDSMPSLYIEAGWGIVNFFLEPLHPEKKLHAWIKRSSIAASYSDMSQGVTHWSVDLQQLRISLSDELHFRI